MVRIFGLMSLLCALLAFSFRQQLDMNEMDVQNRLDVSNWRQANTAEVTVRMEHVVHGHTALGKKKVYGIQAVDGQCRDVIKKLTDLAKEEMAFSSKSGSSIDKDADQAWLNDSSKRGQRQLTEAFAVLDQSDLRDVLNTGDIWTLLDQDTIVRCETNESVRLEEETRTVSGEELLQGDMLLSNADSTSLLQETSAGSRWHDKTWFRRFHIRDGTIHQETIIPYCFDTGLEEEAKLAFIEATAHISQQVSCLKFIDVGYKESRKPCDDSVFCEKSDDPDDALFFQPADEHNHRACAILPSIKVQSNDSDRCWSPVGLLLREYGSAITGNESSQPLNLGSPCQTKAIAIHEILHSLGMLHEQSRTDRDSYITIHWDNINQRLHNNFKMDLDKWHVFGSVPYDPLSIMHYEPYAFAKNSSLPTITAHHPRVAMILGQRQGLSEQDVFELYDKYCSGNDGEATPLVSQKKILDRLVGTDYKPDGIFTERLDPLSTEASCVQFEPMQTWLTREGWALLGVTNAERKKTGFLCYHRSDPGAARFYKQCEWGLIRNTCSKPIVIYCPTTWSSQAIMVNASGTSGDHVPISHYLVKARPKQYEGWFEAFESEWDDLEQGSCLAHVLP